MRQIFTRLIVSVGDSFQCPVCEMAYTLLEEEPWVPVIVSETGEWCEHLDPEVIPAGGMTMKYQVWFREETEE
jgi:hypothetical protein